jgi:hypothetical protein
MKKKYEGVVASETTDEVVVLFFILGNSWPYFSVLHRISSEDIYL